MKPIFKITCLLSLMLTVVLSGCSPKGNINYLSSEESARVAESTDPVANNIITAIATNDYNLFITDFDDAMREVLTEKEFASIVKLYGSNGAATNIALLNVEDRDQFYGVNYGVTYPRAALTMLLVVSKAEPALVSGLWFK